MSILGTANNRNATTILIQANLSIAGGSCFLESAVNDSRVVEVIQAPEGLQCLQLMLSPKGLGTALVTVYDVGLAPPRAASALVLYLLLCLLYTICLSIQNVLVIPHVFLYFFGEFTEYIFYVLFLQEWY